MAGTCPDTKMTQTTIEHTQMMATMTLASQKSMPKSKTTPPHQTMMVSQPPKGRNITALAAATSSADFGAKVVI